MQPLNNYRERVAAFLKSDTFKTLKTYCNQRKKSLLKDFFNSAAEYKELHQAKPSLHKNSPQGDGHPVLVIPGFTANDFFTAPLRHILQDKGYKPYKWKGGFNIGLKDKTTEHLARRLKEIYEENGNQKVSLIGHSLGGFYARTLAQEFPDMVRDVITVDTPFGIGMKQDAAPAFVVSTILKLSEAKYSINNEGMSERLLTPPQMPTTSIFSKIDTVAGWQACLNPATPLSENIEIKATHIGSVWNKEAFVIILDRLAQPEGKWKPHKTPANDAPPPNPNWKPKSSGWKLFPKI